MRTILLVVCLLLYNVFAAQDTLHVEGYMEAYYGYDPARPSSRTRPPFIYHYNRHNEVNFNLVFLRASWSGKKIRCNAGAMAGTYPEYNLAREGLLRHILEANLGLKPRTAGNMWIDAGILPSHIGFEGVKGADCWTLTRSMLADNSPYYETGFRISTSAREGKIYAAALVLNGWQTMLPVAGNTTPSFGTQLTLRNDRGLIFNWSTFVGNTKSDHDARWRYFNNLFLQLRANTSVAFIFGMDAGAEQARKHGAEMLTWYSPAVTGRILLTSKWRVAFRGEYYYDRHGVIIATGTSNGFQTSGFSLNFDYNPYKAILLRVEGRLLSSRDAVFVSGGKAIRRYPGFTASLAISF